MEKFQVNSNRTKNKIREHVVRAGFTIDQADCGIEYAKRRHPTSFRDCFLLVMGHIRYNAESETRDD